MVSYTRCRNGHNPGDCHYLPVCFHGASRSPYANTPHYQHPASRPTSRFVANLCKSLHTRAFSCSLYPIHMRMEQDTEFPGVVARPIGTFKSSSDFHYQTLRCNVDLLKIIQLGLTFCNEDGELAPGVCTYQFNFKFSLRSFPIPSPAQIAAVPLPRNPSPRNYCLDLSHPCINFTRGWLLPSSDDIDRKSVV